MRSCFHSSCTARRVVRRRRGSRRACSIGRSLRELARASPGTLARVLHVSPMVAARFACAVEIGRRIAREVDALPARVSAAAEVFAWAKPRLVPAGQHEELWLPLTRYRRNNVRSAKRVCAGGNHGLSVSAKEVMRHALIEGASAFVLVHNHPSGHPEPSAEDVRFTEHVVTAGVELELPMVDHVVVSRTGYESVLSSCFRG